MTAQIPAPFMRTGPDVRSGDLPHPTAGSHKYFTADTLQSAGLDGGVRGRPVGWKWILTALAVAPALWGAALAAEPADDPVSSAQSRPGGALAFVQPTDGLVIDAGAGVNLHPVQVGVSASALDPVPLMEVQWGSDVHFSLADGLSYAPLHLGPLSLGGIVEPKQDYAAARLTHGLRTADRTEAGALASLVTPFGVAELRARQSLNGDDTKSADFAFDTAWNETSRLAIALEARTSWSNEAFVLPGRKSKKNPHPPAIAKSADVYSVGAQVAMIYRLSKDWWVSELVGKDEIIRARKETLYLRTRSVPQVALVITRRFRIF